MSPVELQARMRLQPFVPFRIVLVDGQTYDIQRPDMIVVGRRNALVGASDGSGPTYYPVTHQVAIRHIKRLESIPQSESVAS